MSHVVGVRLRLKSCSRGSQTHFVARAFVTIHHQVLEASFAQPEKFTGDNRLRCGNCDGLAEGERMCRLGGPLPAVLTISLNRYEWDMRTGERRKVNSRFAYVKSILDMKTIGKRVVCQRLT